MDYPQNITLYEPVDKTAASLDSDSVNMGLLHRAICSLRFGVITGNSILTMYAGATAGAKTTALAFRYRLSSGDHKAASADLFGALTSVAATGLTLTAATFDHRIIQIDVESADLTAGQPWLTFSVDATANPMLISGNAQGEGRFKASIPVTAI